MNHPPKAVSVTKQGQPDGFVPPMAYKAQILDGGFTRLCISTPPARLRYVHQALVRSLQAPLKLLYVRLTDRTHGQLPKPEHYVAVELSPDRVLAALDKYAPLIYNDGRNQLWVRSALNEQIVLEEIGALYAYPDDPLFRDTVEKLGLMEAQHDSMDSRDYVKVNFLSEADEMERSLMRELGLVRWEG